MNANQGSRAAKPSTSLTSLRSVAALSSTARKEAEPGHTSVTPHNPGGGLFKPTRLEVPLPSQEGTKGAIQYALFAFPSFPSSHPLSPG